MKKNKNYDDDDGRTIADMSDIGGPSLFIPRRPDRRKENGPEKESGVSPAFGEAGQEMPRGERRMWIFAALKAGLLIALAYILGAAALIGFLLLIWQ